MRTAGKRRRAHAAFTLLELAAVVFIVSLLVVLAIPNLRQFMTRAGEAGCMANMRSINVGLRGYMQDHGSVWPQGPTPNEERPWEDFWLAVLRPYGINDRTWRCPTIDSSLAAGGAAREDRPRVHYVPTLFSAEPGAAYKWATQPWLIERASAHDQGALICFPDGSIKSFSKVLAEHGVR
jgi:type II secretory pathway pseudopilin PulG